MSKQNQLPLTTTPPSCRECGRTVPPRAIKAQPGRHPDPGFYCSSDCAITAYLRGWAKAVKLKIGYP